jgi:hypothetical protein
VKNVTVHNGDCGIVLSNSVRNTITGVTLSAYAGRPAKAGDSPGTTAHRGFGLSAGSNDNLFTGFTITTKIVHDLSLDSYSMFNVYEDGSGYDMAMDHHGGTNAMNLYTNLNLGLGTRPWRSGGSSTALPHASAYETFWNIRASANLPLPGYDYGTKIIWGPMLNLVGLHTAETAVKTEYAPYRWHFERLDPAALYPPNIRRAQVALRAAAKAPTPTPSPSPSPLPPGVKLTAPATNAQFTLPSTVKIAATATAAAGASIKKVDFFDGTALLKTETLAPYLIDVTLRAGSHKITATATDSRGKTATSAAITVTVNPDPTPKVSLAKPTAGSAWRSAQNITFEATATAFAGARVKKVDFFDGTKLLKSEDTAPYLFLKTLAKGTHKITARVTDSKGRTKTTAAIAITVK